MKKTKIKDSSAIMFLLGKYARPFWKQIFLLILLTLSGNFFMTLKPVVVSGVMEVILTTKGGGQNILNNSDTAQSIEKGRLFDLNKLGKRVKAVIIRGNKDATTDVWYLLRIMSVIFLLAAFLAAALNYLALAVSRWIRAHATSMIRVDILRHLLSLNIGFFHRQKSGELISRLTQDVTSTAQGLGPLVRGFIHHSVLIIIYSTYLFSTSVWLTFGAIGMILLQFGLTKIIKKPIRTRVRCSFDRMAGFSTTLQEMFTSIRVIKSFGAEDYEMDKLGKDIDFVRKAEFREGLVRQVEPYAREFLDSFAIIGIFLIATVQLMRGALTIQGFLLFVYVGRLLIVPINLFAVNITWIQTLLASYERLDELFSERPQVTDGDIIKTDFTGSIELRNISFSYGEEDVIDKVSLRLNKGEVLALVGTSGAGKSTLTDLILRFYDSQKGDIFIDNVNLKELKVSAYRKIFGVVPQESLLFNDTLENNIRYGRFNVGKDDIIKAAKIANAHNFIVNLRGGYETVVGDRGVRLSGGQRQRIAIARAIVARPNILIFDEATSSLDTESEKQVQTAINRVLERSTAIVIAHRLSTVLHADKIVVMNKGRIEAIGKHSELLEKCFTYRRLYELQFEGGHK